MITTKSTVIRSNKAKAGYGRCQLKTSVLFYTLTKSFLNSTIQGLWLVRALPVNIIGSIFQWRGAKISPLGERPHGETQRLSVATDMSELNTDERCRVLVCVSHVLSSLCRHLMMQFKDRQYFMGLKLSAAQVCARVSDTPPTCVCVRFT